MGANGNGKQLRLFGYPMKDWILLLTVLGSVFGGYTYIGGTPNSARDSINPKIDSLFIDLDDLNSLAETSSLVAQQNTIRIYDLEMTQQETIDRIDSLQATMMEGLRNLDGYFRGRLDQIKDP